MLHHYQGLPAAANVEQAIILAQLLIRRDLERRAQYIQDRPERPERPKLAA
jgi:hypothetical protein